MPSLGGQQATDNACQMLQMIPADDRDTWIKVGMAIKSEYGDTGFHLFDEWSKSSTKYQAKSTSEVWRSFKGNGISFGSLVYIAKQFGWQQNPGFRKSIPKTTTTPTPIKTGTKAYALRLWLAANTGDEIVAGHRYAIGKGIDWAAGAGRGVASGKVIGRNSDCIIVPIYNIEANRVQAIQCINADGNKQTFGPVSGGSLILGNTLDLSLPWYVCEGWASAVSMVFHHHNGNGVCACAFGKSNQDLVAQAIAGVYQPKEIIVLREQDS